VDEELRRSLREGNLGAATLLRRAGRVDEALDFLEGLWGEGSAEAGRQLIEMVVGWPASERLRHATRLDRLSVRGLGEAERLWREWFPAAARILGKSGAALGLRAFLYENASGETPVVFLGESGVGGAMAALALSELSGRECVPIAESPVAREIFRYELATLPRRGATLFVSHALAGPWEDDVLDRARETGARLVVRSNSARERHTRRLISSSNVFEVAPLRERREDLRALVELFMAAPLPDGSKPALEVTDDAWEVLRGHRFPGNVRELRNWIWRARMFARRGVITRDTLPTVVELS
jgi:hypothetical protein